jgi:MoxR-like ATPase
MSLKTEFGIRRYFAPYGVRLLLENSLKRKKEAFRVQGFFKLLTRNENGCRGHLDLTEETLERCLKDEIKNAQYDVRNAKCFLITMLRVSLIETNHTTVLFS